MTKYHLVRKEMLKKSLSVFDIFSGIGGFSLGLEKAGMRTVAFCEINPFCQQILKTHWRDIPIFPDISKLAKDDFKTLKQIDVIAGGFPCQDISCAGKRSGLWQEFKRLINDIKPKYAIIEHVANLRSKGLVTVLQDLWEIGYNAEGIAYRLLPLVPLTGEIWYGLLPTPRASAQMDCPSERRRDSPCLETVVKMLPTPTASDATVGDIIGREDIYKMTSSGNIRKHTKNGTSGSLGLARHVRFFPIPTA